MAESRRYRNIINEKEYLKGEVKRELDTEYKARISRLRDELTIEKEKHDEKKKCLREEKSKAISGARACF